MFYLAHFHILDDMHDCINSANDESSMTFPPL